MAAAESEQFSELFLKNCRGGWVVGVAEDEKIIIVSKCLAEIINIQTEILFLPQMIIFLRASGERKFAGVFRISRSKNQGMLRCFFLNQQRNQFAGSIPRKDKISWNMAVF